MAAWLTKTEIIDWYSHQPDEAPFCTFCLGRLTLNPDTRLYYCGNGGCPNQDEYDQDGNLVLKIGGEITVEVTGL